MDSGSHSDSDPFTMMGSLCDDDGIVRQGAMHHGTDYPCTGHAHFAGCHIFCTSPAHNDAIDETIAGLPDDLVRVLRDQSIIIDRDGMVFALIARRIEGEGR